MSRHSKHDKDRKGKGRSPTYPTPWGEWTWEEKYKGYYQRRETAEGVPDFRWQNTVSSSSDVTSQNVNDPSSRITSTDSGSAEVVRDNLLNIPSSHHVRTKDPTRNEESFNPKYKTHGQWEFKRGKVFKVLWSEPIGIGKEEGGTVITRRIGSQGQEYHEKVRRFVIVDPRKGHCLCLPIMTYLGKGTSKNGVHAGDHTIIYTERPQLVPGEAKLANKPIRVRPYEPHHKLERASRLNYAKVYTVEYNVKVWFIGEIHPDSERHLITDYNSSHPPLRARNDPPPPRTSQTELLVNQTNDTGYSTTGGTGYSQQQQQRHQHSSSSLYVPNTAQQPYGVGTTGWPRSEDPEIPTVAFTPYTQITTSSWPTMDRNSYSQQQSLQYALATDQYYQPINHNSQHAGHSNDTGSQLEGQYDSSQHHYHEDDDIYDE